VSVYKPKSASARRRNAGRVGFVAKAGPPPVVRKRLNGVGRRTDLFYDPVTGRKISRDDRS
jgi:hypothetical protein